MSYIYELMDSIKEKIAFNFEGMERKYYMQDELRNFIDIYLQQVIILILNCGMKISSLMWMGGEK